MNSKLFTIILILVLLVLTAIGVWLSYNVYTTKTQLEAKGEELFFTSPDQAYSSSWYSQIFLIDAKAVQQDSQIKILDSNNQPIFSFNKNLYIGEGTEFDKNCESLKVESGGETPEKINIVGINCV